MYRLRIPLWLTLGFCIVPSLCASENKPAAPCDTATPLVLPADALEPTFGAKIQRTMALLSTSTPSRKHAVKILIYGQSISAGMKNSCLEHELRARFPHAQITLENRSISGFSATQLVRSAALDIPLSYPDLIIFHDYGQSAIDYERMLADIRRRTTAEIMLWTDHYGNAGVPGDDEYNARVAREDDASDIVRALAIKYNCELVDARRAWKEYLAAQQLQPKDLLTDNVHLNEHGRRLMTALLLRHFRLNLNAPSDWLQRVRSYEAKRQPDEGVSDEIVFTGKPWRIRDNDAVGESPESRLKLRFVGNRIDIVPGRTRAGDKLGTATLLIDGRKPSEHPELYAFTRPTPAFGADYQPGIRRVTGLAPLQVEDWTLRITDASDGAFGFEVHGSQTGFDGRGRFEWSGLKRAPYGALDFAHPSGDLPGRFISNSRRVVIEYRDFKVLWGQERAQKHSPGGWEIKWSVVPQFMDRYEPAGAGDPALIRTITIAQGLPNSEHTLELIPNGDGLVPVREIIVHQPPLR